MIWCICWRRNSKCEQFGIAHSILVVSKILLINKQTKFALNWEHTSLIHSTWRLLVSYWYVRCIFLFPSFILIYSFRSLSYILIQSYAYIHYFTCLQFLFILTPNQLVVLSTVKYQIHSFHPFNNGLQFRIHSLSCSDSMYL